MPSIDSTSEKDSQATAVDFLTVGSDGVTVQGIKDEITFPIHYLLLLFLVLTN